MKNEYHPDSMTIPGKSLQDTLEALPMTVKQLADKTILSEQTINDILKGNQLIFDTIADELEYGTGVDASFWLNRQKYYDEFQEEKTEKTMKAGDLIKIYEGLIKEVEALSTITKIHGRLQCVVITEDITNKLTLRIQRLKANHKNFRGVDNAR